MFGWLKRKEKTPRQEIMAPKRDFIAEIPMLEKELQAIIRETELMAKVKLLEWKVRKAKEQRAWLEHGVTIPQSDYYRQQDDFFRHMENRIKTRRTPRPNGA